MRAAQDAIVVRGRARSTRYAARRGLRGSPAPLPLFRIDRTGTPHRIAEIDPVHPGGVALACDGDPGWPLEPSMRDGWFEGLPYPMQDMRPQGFLGRRLARHRAAMRQVADDPAHWSDDDVLHALSILGSDTPGDLLVCEHLAGRALDEHLGISCARTRVHRHAGRTFLEVERFDRHGALGRSGVVSWQALNHAFVGAAGRPWAEAVRPLVRQGRVASADAERIQRIRLFGQLIGNTDMHDGNLSFLTAPPSDDAVPLRLAPVYDMLPMAWAPVRGVEPPERGYAPGLPLPAEAPAWREAAHAALRFRRSAAADERIGAGFRRTCADNAAMLETPASR